MARAHTLEKSAGGKGPPETGGSRSDSSHISSPAPKPRGEKQRGARHIPHYYDQHEDYVPVSRPLLRELSTFGWLQEGAGAAGMFFFSGAFWLFATLVYEHGVHLSEYVPWVLMCVISMLFGAVLIWVGYRHFKLKQDRIQDIFRDNPSSNH